MPEGGNEVSVKRTSEGAGPATNARPAREVPPARRRPPAARAPEGAIGPVTPAILLGHACSLYELLDVAGMPKSDEVRVLLEALIAGLRGMGGAG